MGSYSFYVQVISQLSWKYRKVKVLVKFQSKTLRSTMSKRKDYSYDSPQTGLDILQSKAEQAIEDFNQHLEEEKEKREELKKQVEEFTRALQKQLEEEGEKRMSALYEQLQDRLEAINTDLGSLQVTEEELQKLDAVIQVLEKKSKEDAVEDGEN